MDKDIHKAFEEVPKAKAPKAKTVVETGTTKSSKSEVPREPKPETLREFLRAHKWLTSVPMVIIETLVLSFILQIPAAIIMGGVASLFPLIVFAILWGIRYWFRNGELKIHDKERYEAAKENPQKYKVWRR